MFRLQKYQLIFPPAEAHFFSVIELYFPVYLRIEAAELVTARFMATLHGRIGHAAGLIDQVGTGLVDGDRVSRGENADIGDDRCIGVPVTITGRRNLGNEVDEQDLLRLAGDGTEAVDVVVLRFDRSLALLDELSASAPDEPA